MATLAGSTIASTYTYLLKMDGTSGVTSSLVKVEDGDATDTSLSVSTVAISVDATDKIYLDAGGNTYIHEVSADVAQIVAGGTVAFEGDANSRYSMSNNDAGGDYNTIFGALSGAGLTNGGEEHNTFIGHNVAATGTMTATADKNTGVGAWVLNDVTSGSENVGIGYDTLSKLTAGVGNVAIGSSSLVAVKEDENYNIGIGVNALANADEGANGHIDHNIAIGYNSLLLADLSDNSYTCSRNIAIGPYALDATTTNAHTGTIAIGASALSSLTTGSGNTIIGYSAADSQSHASTANNTVVGYQACTGGTGARADSVAIGYRAWGSGGSAENVGGSENVFIGSLSGNGTWVTGASDGNTAVGYSTLAGAMNAGHNNTAVGKSAMAAVTTGFSGVAVGKDALLSNTEGYQNTAVGRDALKLVTTGDNNTAVGTEALQNNIASGNTAVGKSCLQSNTSGAGNTVVGMNAGVSLVEGNYNTVLGAEAFDAGQEDSKCTAVGYQALTLADVSDTGSAVDTWNTAVGYHAGAAVTGGDKNTLIGGLAGMSGANNIAGGTENTLVGYKTQISGADLSNQTVIGSQAQGQAANSVTLGDDNVTAVYMAEDSGAKVWCTNIDSSSDIRIKKNIEKVTIGLDFVNELNPVTFNMKKAEDWDEDLKKEQNWYKKNTTPRDIDDEENKIGFIAQEVKASLDKYSVDCDIYAMRDNDKVQSLDYSRFVVPLVKAIQELSAKVEALENA